MGVHDLGTERKAYACPVSTKAPGFLPQAEGSSTWQPIQIPAVKCAEFFDQSAHELLLKGTEIKNY